MNKSFEPGAPGSSPAAPAPALGALPGEGPVAPPGSSRRGRRLQSNELLGSAQEVEIEHAGAIYRLRQTSLGKLILTK